MKNVALIGCGMIAKYVLKGIENSNTFRCVAVCDINKVKMVRPEFNQYKKYADYHIMLENEKMDYVILLIHHSERETILVDLLQMGYNIICEKPLFSTYFENDLLAWDKIFQQNFLPFVMYHRTYCEALEQVLKEMENGSVDAIRVIYHEEITRHTTNNDITKIKDKNGGGCVFDNFPNCVHGLMQKYTLNYVSAILWKDMSRDYTRKAIINFRIAENNCALVVELDWHASEDRKEFQITKGKRTITYDMQKGYFPAKNSLYDEYKRMFINYWDWMNSEAYWKSLQIANMISEIYKDGEYVYV